MQTTLFLSAEQKLAELFSLHQISENLQKTAMIQPLVTAIAMSDFVFQQLQKQPDLLIEWVQNIPTLSNVEQYKNELSQKLQAVDGEESLHKILRQYRHREMAKLSFLQSNHLATPQQIFETLSDLAETIILATRDWLFERLCQDYGTPMNELGEQQELLILGMGKLGGRELNFSSDIDLIFTYPDVGETVGARKSIDNSKFFTRLGQKLIRALDEITLDGFVYRTDMRLRPFGDSGALVLSFSAMEDYYQEQGRDWERYAMIKAKILGEDLTNINHKYLKQMLRPFVYRRYLDFSAIQSLREMKQKISREVLRRGLEDNIKLGAGGIREVEFIVQTFQMIRGGRDKILQQRSLLSVLPHLATLNLLTPQQIELLKDGYLFLRQVENTLQAINDQQTQTLPMDPQDQQRIAFICGCENWQAFLIQLQHYQLQIRNIFNELIGEDDEQECSEDDHSQSLQLSMWRDILNYQITQEDVATNLVAYPVAPEDYSPIFQIFSSTFQEWIKRPIGVRGREVLRRLLPVIVDQVFQQNNYLTLLPRILNIIDKINTRTTYLELLLEKEQILPQLFTLCSQSVMIAEQIARHPMLLDELIVQNSLTQVIPLEEYAITLQEYLIRIPEEDEEALIDALRQFKQSQTLHIASADILGVLPVMKISDHLTYLAEAILGAVVNLAWKQVSKRFGVPEHLAENEQDFMVIGYGKLGGIELGYNSDLDLVFLHNAPENSQTVGGKKSISSHQFYLKLAQKINSIFNLNTSAGVLYEIDMRLRPSGESGLLVSTFDAYEDYQKNEAWTWESQALVRARAVYGSSLLRQRFETIRQNVLGIARTSSQLVEDICNMRAKMYSHLSHTENGRFHLKTDLGGITDIEFIAQYLVLNYANASPQVAVWSDNVRIFESCAESGILSLEESEQLKYCYTTLRNKIHHLNLLNQTAIVDSEEFERESSYVKSTWKRLFQREVNA
ncbi:bifunctional [glutamate--ammonia ligase]-adenylyl-L-tyrosine phosphorylase/[glutamate--ammonia-ligase] adenylyltransferase [Otariodibacter oris]|uniref:Bifunctional glutamine synthetase adenylyltransferase/adenylyl-removing enzyme n=1 Tax=Otariodibacter oris TaxID=1032623 RepID=A0A420XJS3_9PAST|nr:bifunctional [glutamate--ammonia ligase]-adenylyl-L-tyrosine phosphorylase/[glutamate--ammonia-ligase] adenylyltransferase [Otariodibacter oris]QGM80453.1 bifunctional glutamine synthetase adenylyltransferase/deadenyltransferase [Otariodibacter oris]RKR77401.1 glutamate-ammonia-ligase adenylyltransferase [Otariodibacter oris]